MSGSNHSSPGEVTLDYAGVSDLGCRRKVNEDSMGYFPPADPSGTHLLVVADGVGGSAAGEVASRIAVDVVGQAFFANGDPVDTVQALREAMLAANHAVYAESASNPLHAGMATTCTCAAVKGETLAIGHVGDCRAFLALNGELIQLTQDHCIQNDYAREGMAMPPEMEPMANNLTRWMGMEDEFDVEMSPLMEFKRNNTLVLCSDGLTKTVTPDEILHMVSMHLAESACRRLVELATERGGPDNITVQVARLR